jgi:hypothetical protein
MSRICHKMHLTLFIFRRMEARPTFFCFFSLFRLHTYSYSAYWVIILLNSHGNPVVEPLNRVNFDSIVRKIHTGMS